MSENLFDAIKEINFMTRLKKFLLNPWVYGVGTGIIASLLVGYYFLNFKESGVEIKQNIDGDNNTSLINNGNGDVFLGNNINIGGVQRALNSQQSESLKTVLNNINTLNNKAGKVQFLTKIFDKESKNFANSISSIFSKAGWEVSKLNPTLLEDFDEDVTMFLQPELNSQIQLLCDTFNQMDVSCVVSKNIRLPENSSSDTIYIVVGNQ